MRRLLAASIMIAAWFAIPAGPALAQYGGGGGGGGGGHGGGKDPDADEAAKKKKDDEWNTTANLALPGKKNAGPCPYVKVLYDAGRYLEFKDFAHPSTNSVGYTGEFQGLSSGCSYGLKDPITVKMELLFAFGRGPMAT
ncbi:MAG TPA: Tat pathway signal sequence domain protein, partial [Caulobacteraceae bacterium]|nr:Tat pathway signal sequence domain protein [Caulobacteraceae bacterium]